MESSPSWAELVILMVHGPDTTMRGRISHQEGEGESYATWSRRAGEPRPAFVRGTGHLVDVARDWPRLRIADPDERVRLISDGVTAFVFGVDDEAPHESPSTNLHFGIEGMRLLVRDEAERWVGDDFTRPTGPVEPTTFLGRRAWAVELAPPPHKPFPLQLVVDAETGMVLQERTDDVGLVSEWVSLETGMALDEGLFSWSGPSVSWEQQRSESRRAEEAAAAERADLAERHLGRRTLSVTVLAEVELRHVEPDGTFNAAIRDVATLHRRPLGTTGPERRRSGDRSEVHEWTTRRWAWSLQTWHTRIDPAGLAALRAQLGDD